jgi:hypothetical protein
VALNSHQTTKNHLTINIKHVGKKEKGWHKMATEEGHDLIDFEVIESGMWYKIKLNQ